MIQVRALLWTCNLQGRKEHEIMDTIVAKFGGTSLADEEQFRKVAAIVAKNRARKFVVASAPGKRFEGDIKVTDLLYRCYDMACRGESFEETLSEVEERFKSIRDNLSVSYDISSDIDKIREHLRGTPDRSYMASRGEYLNSRLLAGYLGYQFIDPAGCIHFDEKGIVDFEKSYEDLGREMKRAGRAVIAGFYGSMPDGTIHTFSRGGSDVTGSIAAAAADADLYENWTDVSGLLAADPRIVESPRTVSYISYRELRILSYMGASVLHTDAVLPAARADIPINIRNTNRPQDEGTMIVGSLPEGRKLHAITGVAGKKGQSVIQVEKALVSDGTGFTAVILDILRMYGVPFEQCLTGIDTVSVVIRSDYFTPAKEKILKKIREKLQPDMLSVKENLSMITVVGESVEETNGVTVRILNAVTEKDIEISTINQGAGMLNLIIGVEEKHHDETIRAIYNAID